MSHRTCVNESYCSEYFDDYGAKRRPARDRKVDVWAEVYRADNEKLKHEAAEAKAKFQRDAQATQVFLKGQLDRKHRVAEEEKKASMQFHLQQEKELAEWKAEQKRLEKVREERNKHENILFKETLKEKRRAKEIEQQMKIRAELQEVDRAKRLLEEERQQLLAQKALEAKKVEMVKEENKRMLEIKRKRREAIQAEERETAKRQVIDELKAKASVRTIFDEDFDA